MVRRVSRKTSRKETRRRMVLPASDNVVVCVATSGEALARLGSQNKGYKVFQDDAERQRERERASRAESDWAIAKPPAGSVIDSL